MIVPLAQWGFNSMIGLMALTMNFVCSNWAAKQIILLHDRRGASSPWMFLWGPLFFFLNVALAFGGCATLERVASSSP